MNKQEQLLHKLDLFDRNVSTFLFGDYTCFNRQPYIGYFDNLYRNRFAKDKENRHFLHLINIMHELEPLLGELGWPELDFNKPWQCKYYIDLFKLYTALTAEITKLEKIDRMVKEED